MTNQELVAWVKKNPIGVGCGVLALASGLGVYFRSDRLPEVAAELEQVSAEGQRLRANIRNAAHIEEHLAAMNEAAAEIGPRVIRPGELANNLQFFYRVEAETGTKLLDLRQLPPPTTRGPKATYAAVPFAVSVQGEYNALIEFLRRLEYGGVYCRILTASMTHAGGEFDRAAPLRLDLSLELLGQP